MARSAFGESHILDFILGKHHRLAPRFKGGPRPGADDGFVLYDDGYHGGAFMLAANFGFYTSFKPLAEPAPPPKVPVPFDFAHLTVMNSFLRAGS